MDTAILDEVHASLNSSKLDESRAQLAARWNNLAARKAMFQQAWERRDVAELPTMRVPRVTGDLGSPYATVRLPVATKVARPVIQHPVIAAIGRAVERFYLEHGAAPEVVVCWALDILLLGDDRIAMQTDIVSVDVSLITESEMAGYASHLICDARGI